MTKPSLQSSNSRLYGDESSLNNDSCSGSSGYGTATTNKELAAEETKAVRATKALVVSVLLVSAAAAATVTAIFSKREVVHDFEKQFENFASEIDEVSQNKARISYNIMASFSASITSVAEATKADWPAFSVPHIDVGAQYAMETTGADIVAFMPIVTEESLTKWEAYSTNNTKWLEKGWTGSDIPTIPPHVHPPIADIHPGEGIKKYLPLWQTHPVPQDPSSIINFDLLTNSFFHEIFDYVLANREPILSELVDITNVFGNGLAQIDPNPRSLFVYPVYDTFDTEPEPQITGILMAVVPWNLYFKNVLDRGAASLKVVVKNSCGDVFTFELQGPNVIFDGYGDTHSREFDHLRHVTQFEPFEWHDEEDDTGPVSCHFELHIYPTTALYNQYNTKRPILLAIAVLGVFLFATSVFLFYDFLVQRRQRIVMDTAVRSDAIVSSLFPSGVRDRLFRTSNRKKRSNEVKKEWQNKNGNKSKGSSTVLLGLNKAPKFRLKNYLAEDSQSQTIDDEQDIIESKPIADLFPHTTVLFADIGGFTAWSSVREPSQVFALLEAVYGAFDQVARRRNVFKVETIGDCYVAVTGLPESRQDHAVVMVRYARECLHRFNELTKKLETTLGPDTGDLTMRFGLHSGPVTAGVLRGDKSRFQLFGDTVNTAARMESTGKKNRIQISQETADLLIEAGKGHWFKARESIVVAKGKGELQTYWIFPREGVDNPDYVPHIKHRQDETSNSDMENTSVHSDPQQKEPHILTKADRMIGWNVDVLIRLLQRIVAARNAKVAHKVCDNSILYDYETKLMKAEQTALEQVTEFVPLAEFNLKSVKEQTNASSIRLDAEVIKQLQVFVAKIASLYRNNNFHNFEHASHVLMSVNKLLSRIVAYDVNPEDQDKDQDILLRLIHKKTYGMASDPLTQFAVVFSALIHDVDHRGVPNFVLNGEEKEMADKYSSKSTAEQNSVDVAWSVLMEPQFKKLRDCIYTNEEELERFHQVVINTVMATDIFDKEHATLRKRRWEYCFENEDFQETCDNVNRKAIIVIEHLIQASDVAHTMQHWHVYQKWNERLFFEMYTAYKMGRMAKDPSIGWYDSEIGFFDSYIIPLAKKLKDCGVFGVSSDEYLNYALANRQEWAMRGRIIVENMKTRAIGCMIINETQQCNGESLV